MTETPKVENPLLSRARLPGETHTLPSRGLFYKNGELADTVKNGEVHIFPMTTIDEITMRSSDLLFTGKAIEQVFTRCVPDVKKADQLFQKDVDFILSVLRKVSYGEDVEITYTHTCPTAKAQSYNVNLPAILQQAKKIDPTTIGSKFTVVMPNEQIVSIVPLRYEGTIEMLQATDANLSLERREELAVKFMLNMIESVDEIKDKDKIKEWLKVVPAGYGRLIDKRIRDAQDDWGIDFNVTVQCRDCEQLVKINAPLNPLFFFI